MSVIGQTAHFLLVIILIAVGKPAFILIGKEVLSIAISFSTPLKLGVTIQKRTSQTACPFQIILFFTYGLFFNPTIVSIPCIYGSWIIIFFFHFPYMIFYFLNFRKQCQLPFFGINNNTLTIQ